MIKQTLFEFSGTDCKHLDCEISDQKFADGRIHKKKVCKLCKKHLGFVKSTSNEDFKMPAGKYSGKPIIFVARNHPDYAEWWIKTFGDNNNISKRFNEIIYGIID